MASAELSRAGGGYYQPATLRVRNILCPVGFSEFSRRAFNYATSIARHFQARLFVQHTVHLSVLDIREPDAVLQEARQKAEGELRRLISDAWYSQLQMPEVIPLGNAGNIRRQILDNVVNHNIDLLVMSTHGRKGLERLLPGSLTERIVHEVICPVLILSHPERDFIAPEDSEPVHLKTILLATDFSAASDRAADYGLRWASEWAAKLILFHAIEDLPPETRGMVDLLPEQNTAIKPKIKEAADRIRRAVPETERNNCELDYEIRCGNATEQLLQVAEQRRADLIVMGTHGRSRMVPWGGTVIGVVRDGRFPVLVVRQSC